MLTAKQEVWKKQRTAFNPGFAPAVCTGMLKHDTTHSAGRTELATCVRANARCSDAGSGLGGPESSSPKRGWLQGWFGLVLPLGPTPNQP